MRKLRLLIAILATSMLWSCGGGSSSNSSDSTESRYWKSPVDILIRDMANEPVFTIILNDMDVQGNFAKTYLHQYKIITEKNGQPQSNLTKWYDVSSNYFNQHMNNMGMELAAKTLDGKINKTVSPAGYSNYVGNKDYGQWTQRSDGSSFWEFYGKYAMMSSVINMLSPVPYGYYNDYRSNYYGRRPYYGPEVNGSSYYGTRSTRYSNVRQNSRWSTSPTAQSYKSSSGFKGRVNSTTSRSTTTTSKTPRTTSRFSSGVSRSSGGGYGK